MHALAAAAMLVGLRAGLVHGLARNLRSMRNRRSVFSDVVATRYNGTAAAAVAALWAAAFDKLLTSKAECASTTVACLNVNVPGIYHQ